MVVDVDVSFDTIYFRVSRTEVRAIDTSWDSRVNFANSEVVTHVQFKNIFYQKVKLHCKSTNLTSIR